ncbi:DUF4041 domain-containing protein [Microbacterium karelineae]|uniref:DUF4041 domain-containing protein n=1 Tax=Microbacterium karelineae TaxID=2654283 RepID=UPI001E538BB2|nr:DUF4041 domain-containing protein [Microbacterium karelineae]
MSEIPSGWYPTDAQGTLRWWNGTQWTEHTAPASGAEPAQSLRSTRRDRRAHSAEKAIEKLSKSAARARAADLQAIVNRFNAHEFDDVDKYRAHVEAELATTRDAHRDEMERLTSEIARLRDERDTLFAARERLKGALVDLRWASAMQEAGLFDYEHAAEHSATLSADLEALRAKIKTMVREKRATTSTSGFTFNNSTAKGNKFVNDMSKILLRAFNAEAENCVKTMRAGNLEAAQKRLTKVAEQIAKQGDMIDLRITHEYLHARLQELSLAARHLQAVQAEKEAERERRAELREQKKAEAELAREHERLDKERAKYILALEALEASGDDEGVARMRERLEDVDKAIEDVDYRAANMRAGYVYVISNVGSFGPGIVKIGMTRRLDPMDRVRELGDASVPFRFDVHALFFTDDAVDVESMLHRTFAEQRLNKVNTRREYFRVTPWTCARRPQRTPSRSPRVHHRAVR